MPRRHSLAAALCALAAVALPAALSAAPGAPPNPPSEPAPSVVRETAQRAAPGSTPISTPNIEQSVARTGDAPARATILVVGDSLSAEYGLPRGSGWVGLLAARLASEAPEYSVANASISGDTTSGALARFDALLQRHRPAIVILELGANDGLRGLRLEAMAANLQALAERSAAHGARVLLVGMQLPPNYGADYQERFHRVYVDVARRNHLAFTPFLLDGFADRLDWFQDDRIHPLAQAQPRMMENVWPALRDLLPVARRHGAAGPPREPAAP